MMLMLLLASIQIMIKMTWGQGELPSGDRRGRSTFPQAQAHFPPDCVQLYHHNIDYNIDHCYNKMVVVVIASKIQHIYVIFC